MLVLCTTCVWWIWIVFHRNSCLVVHRNESLSFGGWWTCGFVVSMSRKTLSSDVARMLFSTWLRSSPLRAGNMRRIALSACPVRYQTHHREL